jgi:hypothetical protein
VRAMAGAVVNQWDFILGSIGFLLFQHEHFLLGKFGFVSFFRINLAYQHFCFNSSVYFSLLYLVLLLIF